LSKVLDTSDEWITERTGIKARRIHDAGTTTADLAARAATGALAQSGVGPDDIDVVIVATGTPDSPVPATAARVAAQLGIETSAYDVSGACCGFVHALHNAAGLLVDPSIKHVLVIGAERYSTLVDPADRGTAILFGDGAGALVVGKVEGGNGAPSA